ncbi:MAG: ABC-F family ATP-binding cassette domain-containing protein [Candidatus Sumerlaeia bacterium]|nr:ABC-F family ATP-binding cassette domain-containing protein [Candidatus Sumerlaeia bacterium]
MFDVQNVTLHFGGRTILDGVSFRVDDGARAAIIGPNGMGKSTLLKVIAGEISPESGAVTYPHSAELGYLPQNLEMNTDNSVEEECRAVFVEVLEHEAEMRTLEERMAHVAHDTPEFADIADRYEYLMHEMERRDVYTMDAQIGRVLDGLGFLPKDRRRKCREFSGGWQMRIALARLLLRNPDILLLDEPTNHLDIESIEWLADWIRGHTGSVLMVSHERMFMDALVTKVVELDSGEAHLYDGNYSSSIMQREERRQMALRVWKNQQQMLAHHQKFIDRFRSKATKASAVQSRLKMIDKMDLVDEPDMGDNKTIAFRFPPAPRSGKEVLVAEGIAKSYGPLKVLDGIGLTIYRGEKVALAGHNGAGKTTFMRILAGRLAREAGEVTFGGNVDFAYFAQYDVEDLHPENTVLDEFLAAAPLEVSGMARSVLGAFLFRGEDIEKKVSVLSGGERTRLRLAKMLCGKANLLLMDEPTNHLDLGSRLTLEEALRQYDGSVLLVSHDRYFLDAVTTRVVEIEGSKLTSYPGTYSEYVDRKKAMAEAASGAPPAPAKALRKSAAPKPAEPEQPKLEKRDRDAAIKRASREHRLAEKRIAELEDKMYDVEASINELENQIADPSNAADHRKLGALAADLEKWKAAKAKLDEAWIEAQEAEERLAKELEELG